MMRLAPHRSVTVTWPVDAVLRSKLASQEAAHVGCWCSV